MQMAFAADKEEYFSPMPITSSIVLSLIFDQKGKIIAVEILRSTGIASLDEHIARKIQTIKGIALPPSQRNQEFPQLTISAKVTIHAGSGHIIFDYKDASGVHII
jgi:hypothetical protein